MTMQKLHLFPILQIQVWLSKNPVYPGIRQAFFNLAILLLVVSGSPANAKTLYIGGTSVPEPVQLVESQANTLLKELSSRKKEFDKDPQALLFFARHVALSHWDFTKTSRLMLGKYWRDAKPEQQTRFQQEFLRTLLRYVVKAYGFYDESLVEVVSYRWQPKTRGGWVRSVVRLPAGIKVSVDYRMFQDKKKQWKMIDVRVEGISLINSKRKEYRGEISRNGLEVLIKTMYEKNQKVLKPLKAG